MTSYKAGQVRNESKGRYRRVAGLAIAAAALFAMATSAAHATPTCGPVADGYNKMFSSHTTMDTKNTGAANVTAALGTITGSVPYTDTCKKLREETLNGEPTVVYEEDMGSSAGQSHGTVWISKASGGVVKQDVEVDMGAGGKGRQVMTITYKK